MLNFLIDKNYDIGIEIFNKIIVQINLVKLLNTVPNILINKKISNKIKESTLKYLYQLMVKDQHTLQKIIKIFKMFVDWIIIPEQLLQYFINLLKNIQNEEMHKEIIYFLGNYFSLSKIKQEKYLNEIISIIQGNNYYQYIINNVKSINKKNEQFYLFACLNYLKEPMNFYDEFLFLTIPTMQIIDYIMDKNPELDKKGLLENITYLNNYWKYKEFSPKRDQILRKLFFNNKSNDINRLKLLCC